MPRTSRNVQPDTPAAPRPKPPAGGHRRGWRFDHGWYLRRVLFTGEKLILDLKPGTTYAEARAARDLELKTGRYEQVWLHQRDDPR